jgi:hypothetical protein
MAVWNQYGTLEPLVKDNSVPTFAEKSPFYLDGERPFPQRHESMLLDVVRPQDVPRGKIMFPKHEDKSLKTSDIPTAQPTYHHLKFLDRPDLCVGSTDTEHVGGQARTYYPPMDRKARDLNLTTADIEFAQPRANKFKGTRRVDPVCPNYEMPTSYKRAPTPPRHNGRVTHDISDIEGSSSKRVIPDRNYVRDPNEGRDIEYASANYQERMGRAAQRGVRQDRQLDVSDIAGSKRVPIRSSHPLDPEYKVPTHATTSLHVIYSEEQNQNLARKDGHTIGPVHGSKSRKLQWDNGEPHFSLMREDIAGTVPQRWIGSVPANIYDHHEDRPMISFHDPHDIPGAQVGSLKKGLEGVAQRQLNPLNPKYSSLDGDTRPCPVPHIEAERGHPRASIGSHPMLRNRTPGGSSSTPNLRQTSGGGQLAAAGARLVETPSQPTLRLPSQTSSRGGPPSAGSRRPHEVEGTYSDNVGNTIRLGVGAQGDYIGDTIRMTPQQQEGQ